jgi:hypothetical protein
MTHTPSHSYVIFSNQGEIDPRLMTTFGTNVKEGDSPIGFFGTGFKYAIAILLRNSCEVVVHSGAQRYKFSARTEAIRGKDFALVYMNEQPMGFTLDLGKNWKFWTSYRELYSNCLDENGSVSTAASEPPPRPGYTQICVKGARFANVHANRSQYFLETDPLHKGAYASFHPGRSSEIYYKNIQVGVFADGRPSVMTYNFRTALVLTEDRTLKDHRSADMWLAFELGRLSDAGLLKRILTAGKDFHEYHLDWPSLGSSAPSRTFLSVVHEMLQTDVTSVPPALYTYWRTHSIGKFRPEVRAPNARETLLLQKATAFLKAAGFDLSAYPINVADSLGNSVMGFAYEKEIFISSSTFEVGLKQLVMTLLEEYVHLKYGVCDETRAMQERLFALLVSAHELRLEEAL